MLSLDGVPCIETCVVQKCDVFRLFGAVLRLLGVIQTSYAEMCYVFLLFGAVLPLLGVTETSYAEMCYVFLLFGAVLPLLGVTETSYAEMCYVFRLFGAVLPLLGVIQTSYAEMCYVILVQVIAISALKRLLQYNSANQDVFVLAQPICFKAAKINIKFSFFFISQKSMVSSFVTSPHLASKITCRLRVKLP